MKSSCIVLSDSKAFTCQVRLHVYVERVLERGLVKGMACSPANLKLFELSEDGVGGSGQALGQPRQICHLLQHMTERLPTEILLVVHRIPVVYVAVELAYTCII